MKKQIVTAAAFAACLALCAAVWPQKEPAAETPALPAPPTVTATQPKVPEMPKIEEVIVPEKEKADATQPEPVDEAAPAPEPIPAQEAPSSELQSIPEQNITPSQGTEPDPVSPNSTPDNMVYVPGFGWLENQGPNHRDYAADMYENGNKIGRMN